VPRDLAGQPGTFVRQLVFLRDISPPERQREKNLCEPRQSLRRNRYVFILRGRAKGVSFCCLAKTL